MGRARDLSHQGKNYCRKSKKNLSPQCLENEQKKSEKKSERCKSKRVLFSFPSSSATVLAAWRGDNRGNKLTMQTQIKPWGKAGETWDTLTSKALVSNTVVCPLICRSLDSYFLTQILTLTYTGAEHCHKIRSSQFSVLSQMPSGWWMYIFFLGFNLNIQKDSRHCIETT